MKQASPEAVALAGLAATLFDLALVAMAMFAFADRYAPPQDLPWKPLEIEHPLGLATRGKLERATATREGCMALIAREGIAFAPVPDRIVDGFCTLEGAGRVGPQGALLSPAGPVMTCPLTAALAVWARQSVQPAARELLGAEVVQIDHYGTFACRRVYGRDEGRISQHAHAAAVDIAAFRLADGRTVSVLRRWAGEGPEAAFLRRVRDEGCGLFRVALSPDYNAAHANHLHFDMSPYRLCR